MEGQYLLGIILLISICELFGQSCLKYFNKNQEKTHYYFLAVLFYSIVCYLLVQSYKYKGMGIINVLWSGISILVILSSSMVFFGEEITTMDKIGVVLVVLGIFLISYEGVHPTKKLSLE
jgi:multidrug transporter EmrE-like cation transporter